MIEKLFKLTENGTTVRTEVRAGAVTFMTMAYIIFVQPAVMQGAGMDFGAVMVATCLSSALATLVMAFVANYPIALAPCMGELFFRDGGHRSCHRRCCGVAGGTGGRIYLGSAVPAVKFF